MMCLREVLSVSGVIVCVEGEKRRQDVGSIERQIRKEEEEKDEGLDRLNRNSDGQCISRHAQTETIESRVST
jgi:hypothetical protein